MQARRDKRVATEQARAPGRSTRRNPAMERGHIRELWIEGEVYDLVMDEGGRGRRGEADEVAEPFRCLWRYPSSHSTNFTLFS